MPPVARGPLALGGNPWESREALGAVSRLGIECMKAGEWMQGQDGSVALEARPVLASKPICLRCDDNWNLGDPVGAVIYAFQQDRAKVAAAPGE